MVHRKEVLTYEIEPTSETLSNKTDENLPGFFMEYKAEKFEKELVIADKYYPSTQRCSSCGHIKTGDEKITLAGNQKHGTRHDEYHCYQCGYKGDRDYNAVLNLLALIK